MSSTKINKINLGLLLVTIFVPVCFGVEVKSDPNNIFNLGDYKDIEILVPKYGFLGSPPSASSLYPHIGLRKTEKRDDFRAKYIRIKVSDIKPLKTTTRVAFQLFDIDPNNISISDPNQDTFIFYELLYLKSSIVSYIFARQLDLKGYQSNIESAKEPSMGGTQLPSFNGWIHGIQFPIRGLFLLDMNLENRVKYNFFVDERHGIAYEGPFKIASSDSYKTNVVFFKKANQEEQKNKSKIKYFSKKDKKITDSEQPESVQVLILGKEVQTWSNDNKDWLWQEMEYTDDEGNVTMRCKRLR